MECWLKSSREEQGWGQQAADNNQVPGTSFSIIIIILIRGSSSRVQSPASPPLQTQTLRGQGSWTWPCGPQENVHLVWGIIWDLFGRRPVSGSIMPHYPRVLCVHRAQPSADTSTLHFTYTFAIPQSIPPTDNIIHLNTSQLPWREDGYK